MLSPYFTHIAILIGIYAILAMSLNLTIGFTGLLNLGHVAFFGIGAYTSALLTIAGLPFPVSFVTAGLVASGFGFLLMLGVRKIKGDYLALVTLGFSFVIYSIFLNWTGLTRGPLGIPGIPKPEFGPLTISTNGDYLIFVIVTATIVGLFLWRLTKSRYGRLLEAVRDDELAAQVLGKNTFKVQAQSMMISSFLAGIAGSLFAHYITYIDPSSFFISEIILVLTILIVGGLGSLPGSVIAAAIILIIPELLRFIGLPSTIIGPMRQILYAGLLLGVLMLRPRGLLGKIDL